MTTTDIATVNESSIELLPPKQPTSLHARQMLLAHAEMMNTAYELADKMCQTNLVPTRFRGKAEDGCAAILYGAELGLNPIQSLQRIIPIYGMPTLEARTMVALLKSRGYRVKTLEQSDDQVTVEGVDLDGERYVSQWTMARAVRAGYVPQTDERTGKFKTNANGKLIGNEKYLTDPQAMLKAKAQAEVCRDMAPDILLGISYTAEELQSERFDDEPQRAPQPRSEPITVEELFEEPKQDTAEEKPAKAEPIAERQDAIADAATQLDDPPADEPEAPPTAAMNKKMHALFRSIGLTDRDDRLIVTGHILGYKLDSSAALTKSEASKLIDTIEGWESSAECDDSGQRITAPDRVREILNTATMAAENEAVKSEGTEGN